MNKLLWLAVIGALSMISVVVPLNVFGATINCNPIPNPCNGTNSADTMTANDGDGSAQYRINGLAGSDTIIANEIGGFAGGLLILGGDNDDKISGKIGGGNILTANGESGNDLLTVSGGFIITGLGGSGADRITASGAAEEVRLFHNTVGGAVEPDGSKDTLNCGNAPDSTAVINLEDGDFAVNCKVVVTN